jgi:hypothetical protein
MPTHPNDPRLNAILGLMDSQREAVFAALVGLSEAQIWQRPSPKEWSIGEILDHSRKLIASTLVLFQILWPFEIWAGWLGRKRGYPVEIADPYRRPNFPMHVGWMWPPRRVPVPLATLRAEMEATHRKVRRFYETKGTAVLGNIYFYDPAVGLLNMIQALRVGIHHDQLHFDDVLRMAKERKG